MDTTIYFIRHAQSHPSAKKHHSKWPLSDVGKIQSEKLAALLPSISIEKIFSSPFTRCLQTIEPFATSSKLNIRIESDLRERLVTKEITDEFEEIWRKSWEDFDYALPECETSATAQKRFVEAVLTIEQNNRGSVLAVCAHGNVIGLFLNWLDRDIGRNGAEMLTNPDVLKLTCRNGDIEWHREFKLPGIGEIATHYSETPFSR